MSVRPHPLFERRGNDIWCELPLTFSQAALGAEVSVPTLEGKVPFTIKEGTQPGETIRLKGKGFPFVNGRGRGDEIFRVTVEVPRNLTPEQKKDPQGFRVRYQRTQLPKTQGLFDKLKDMINS